MSTQFSYEKCSFFARICCNKKLHATLNLTGNLTKQALRPRKTREGAALLFYRTFSSQCS